MVIFNNQSKVAGGNVCRGLKDATSDQLNTRPNCENVHNIKHLLRGRKSFISWIYSFNRITKKVLEQKLFHNDYLTKFSVVLSVKDRSLVHRFLRQNNLKWKFFFVTFLSYLLNPAA